MRRQHTRLTRRVLATSASILFMAASLTAQNDTMAPPPSGGTVANYDFSNLGGIPMYVNVLGYVRNPGRYRVPSSTRLIELIAWAGGPTDNAFIDRVAVTRDPTVDSSLRSAIVVTYDLQSFIASGDPVLNPILYPNSTVFVPGDSNPPTFQSTLGIVASVSTIVLSIIGIFVAVK